MAPDMTHERETTARAPTTNSGRGVLKPRTDCDGLTAERGDCCAPTRIGLLGIGGRRHQQCEDAEGNRARRVHGRRLSVVVRDLQRLSKRQRPAVVSESTSAAGLKCVPSRNPRHLASVAVGEIGHFLLKSARLFTWITTASCECGWQIRWQPPRLCYPGSNWTEEQGEGGWPTRNTSEP
jgi:hypothetical protein